MVSSTFHAEDLWKTLSRATVDKRHPWRVVVLSTSGPNGANSRNIILRAVESQRALCTFYTDLRSGKIADITHDPRVSLLFWNPRSNEQLRAWGDACVVNDPKALDLHWSRIPDYARKDYATLSAPGALLTEDQALDITSLRVESARQNFRLIQVQIQRMDYLKLDREGHQRFGLNQENDAWVFKALVP
ncbi:MAG: pyridoxamine 5'-phosphate oxidase family protein [Limnobacter sp.]|nr:pyridoxamine 5'-phosphate oxidase family protein [Limnobacter sp.]